MNNLSISLGKRQLVDSIWKSAGIEGLGTTFPNTEKILSNLPVQTRRDEVLFIVNMKRAWYFLFDNIDYPNNLAFLRELNKICMEELSYDAGGLRTVPVTIGGTSWAPELPQEGIIIEHLELINGMSDKLEADPAKWRLKHHVIWEEFHKRKIPQNYVVIFLDGNKRVAQLMCNKIMMENDIGIFSVPYDEIDHFKELLVEFYETDNPDKIKDFFRSKCLLLNPSYKTI